MSSNESHVVALRGVLGKWTKEKKWRRDSEATRRRDAEAADDAWIAELFAHVNQDD